MTRPSLLQSVVAHTSPRTIFWLGLTIVSVTIFFASVRVSSSIRDLQGRIAELGQLVQSGSAIEPRRIGDDLTAIAEDSASIRDDIGWLIPFAQLFGWLPQFGGDAAAAQHLFNMFDALAASSSSLYQGWLPILDHPSAEDKRTIVERAVMALPASNDAFRRANAFLQLAISERSQFDVRSLSTRTAGLVQRVDTVMPLLGLAIDGSLAAPQLLGATGARSYLIVAENEDELRATGGFATSVGLLTIDNGKLGELAFEDSYQVDDLNADFSRPPAPLENYMLAGYWLFRDANWSPDFPTAARQMASLYELGQHKKVDGVIALDQEMVRLVVQALQPVEIGGETPTRVTGDNLLAYMRESWAPPPGSAVGDAWLARKGFIGRLAGALLARIQGGGPLNAGGLARGIYDGLMGKHLMLYLPGTPVATSLATLGWDGALRSTAGDYALVVDSNIGFNKANALVNEQFSYEVTLAADLTASAQMTMKYRHLGGADATECIQQVLIFGPSTTYDQLTNTCYWDYVRLYVPRGTALVDSTKLPIPASQMLNKRASDGRAEILANDSGKDAFATLFVVKRGGQQELRFKYQLPAAVIQPIAANRWRYTLTWQKQAGTPAIASEFRLNLPPGFNVISARPADGLQIEASDGGLPLSSTFKLDADKTFEVVIQRN